MSKLIGILWLNDNQILCLISSLIMWNIIHRGVQSHSVNEVLLNSTIRTEDINRALSRS